VTADVYEMSIGINNQCVTFDRTQFFIALQRTQFFIALKMSSFVLKKEHLRETLLFYFNFKKSAAESHRLLMQAYGEHALSETTCRNLEDLKTTSLI